MSLPPWKPANAVERAAFTRWVVEELDRLDAVSAARAGSDPVAISYLGAAVAAVGAGLRVMLARPGRRPGPKPRDPASGDFTAFERAALDVQRIRAVFEQHWGKRNRTTRPMAEEIAAERWALSDADTARLIDKFQRKS